MWSAFQLGCGVPPFCGESQGGCALQAVVVEPSSSAPTTHGAARVGQEQMWLEEEHGQWYKGDMGRQGKEDAQQGQVRQGLEGLQVQNITWQETGKQEEGKSRKQEHLMAKCREGRERWRIQAKLDLELKSLDLRWEV